jgi:hypothetical protein
MPVPHHVFPRIVSAAMILAAAALCVCAEESPTPEGLDFFERKIRPILVAHCYECHAADSKILRAGLSLDTRDGIRAGGESGSAVVPGNVAESLIVDALRYESFEMPPKGRLPENVVADFVAWIELGAPDPRDGEAAAARSIDIAEGRKFWSFQALNRAAAPAVQQAGWPRDDVDCFLLARMEAEGLAPAADADRVTLIRRVTFDLTGLPPTLEEIDAFVSDPASDDLALASVVDRLLASRGYAERWGRHWLDVARFSESTGGGRSLLYGEAWRYRDYVIQSFAEDKPFDRFVVEQIAGDLLPADGHEQATEQITATGFLELGPFNYEEQDKLQLQMDVIDEQMDTLGRTFLAMTIGCARCHDHKFDPIPTADYYALAGIFKSTDSLIDANVSSWIKTPLPEPPEATARREEHKAALASLDRRIKQAEREAQQLRAKLPQATATLDDPAAVLTGKWTESKYTKGFTGEGYRHATGEGSAARYEFAAVPGRYEVRVTFTPERNRSPNALVVVTHAKGEAETRIDQRKKGSLDANTSSLGEFTFDKTAVVTVSTAGTTGVVIADSVQLVRLDALPEDDADTQGVKQDLAAAEEQVKTLTRQKKSLEEQAPPPAPEIVSVREAQQIADAAICIRGNARQLGEIVPRGVLQVATRGEPPVIPANQSGRLQLAEWVASPENPLTARVFVNRVWQHLFGEGLVRTVDNFGAPGELPSHPELLDHVAAGFIDDGWSVQQLIRRLVLSRAYRLASSSSEAAERVDPENRLLSHQNRRRLEAEAIHDAILSLSGRLEPFSGGPTAKPKVAEYGYPFEYGRRAVYLPVFRNSLPDLFTAFDFPDPNLSIGRRNRTTLSTQALYLLNSPFVQEQARVAAERLQADAPTDEARIDLLYRRAVGRLPTANERDIAFSFLASAGAGDAVRLQAWTSLCQAVMASIDFRYVD